MNPTQPLRLYVLLQLAPNNKGTTVGAPKAPDNGDDEIEGVLGLATTRNDKSKQGLAELSCHPRPRRFARSWLGEWGWGCRFGLQPPLLPQESPGGRTHSPPSRLNRVRKMCPVPNTVEGGGEQRGGGEGLPAHGPP